MGPSLKNLNSHHVGVALPHRKRSSRSNVGAGAGAGAAAEHIALIVPMHTQTQTHVSPPDTTAMGLESPPSPLSCTDVKAATAGAATNPRIPLVVKDLNAQAERLTRPQETVFPLDIKVPHEGASRIIYAPDVKIPADRPARPQPFVCSSDSDAHHDPTHLIPLLDAGAMASSSDAREQQQRGRKRGAQHAAPPSYDPLIDGRVHAHAQGTLLQPSRSSAPPPPPPSSRGSRSRARDAPPSEAGAGAGAATGNYGAKKHVQAFFKAFGDTFEPRMKGVVDRSMDRQSSALRSTIAKHEEEVRELVRKHDDRMTQVIVRHKDDMAVALLRAEYQMEQHLSVKTHEQAVALYEKELADYFRKRGLGRMLFWAAILGIVVIAVVFNFEIMNGHLGGILGFSISAGYMYLSYRRSLPIRPRRPCPYPGIEGPYTPQGPIGE